MGISVTATGWYDCPIGRRSDFQQGRRVAERLGCGCAPNSCSGRPLVRPSFMLVFSEKVPIGTEKVHSWYRSPP
jgi:hypothetical protein